MIFHKNLYLIMFLLMLVNAGCTGTTPRPIYYQLSPIATDMLTPEVDIKKADFAIGIGPVSFPDNLDRPSIITETGRNQLNINEFHRWGGSVQQNFTRVMVKNLSDLLQTDQVMARPWERYFKPDVRVTIDIQRLSGRLGEYALLDITWMIIEEGKDSPTSVHRSEIREGVADNTYDALVAAQSRALGKLCLEIAQTLSPGA